MSKLSHPFIYQIMRIVQHNNFYNLSDINVFRQLCKSITNTDPYVNQIIIKNSKLINLVELKRFINLEILYLSVCNRITDITPLQNLTNLTNLQSLNINRCNKITDIISLQYRTNLQSLNISGLNKITDITALQHLTNLQIIR